MTPDLPRQLAPWARELAIFPPQLALTIGGLVARLAGLIGEGTLASSEQGEPDGYDGTARKGTYDRLLPAEWLLFEEVPEEFFRRVVSGEHVFLKRAFSKQATTKRSVALFDTSADQLGAPRLAHLAVLILLAQRASDRGSSFEWGVIQDASPSLHTGVTPASVLELLHSRGRRSVTSSDLDRWAAAFASTAPSEWWLVGGQTIEQEALRLRASSISAADVLEPDPPARIVVRTTTPSARKAKEIVLEIPENRAAVKLLRDPFSIAAPIRRVTPTGIAPDSAMVFSLSSRLLYVQPRASTLITVQVPNSVRAKVGPPVTFDAPEGQEIRAAGYSTSYKRTFVVCSRDDGAFVVHRLSKRGATSTSTDHYAAAKDLRPVPFEFDRFQPLGVLGQRHLGFSHGARLVELFDEAATIRWRNRIYTSTVSTHGFGWLEFNDGHPRMMWMTTAGKEPTPHETRLPLPLPHFEEVTKLWFAGGILAFTMSGSTWVILHENRRTSLSVDPTCTVVGVVQHSSPREVGLLALDESKTRIDLLTHGRREALVTTSTAISSLVVSGRTSEFAYITDTGELGIYLLSTNALVTRLDGDTS